MVLKGEKLVLLTCAAFILTSLSFQSGALATGNTATSSQQEGVKPAHPYIENFPEEVNRPVECEGLSEEECNKLEIDTNTVMEPFPG